MLILPPLPPRRLRRTQPPMTSTAPLLLVSAAYDEVGATLTLAFDRAIDIAALDPGQLTVADGTFNATLFGGVAPATLLAPTTVRIPLEWIDDAPLGPVTMNATSLTGIVAMEDGAAWEGASGLGLPFP